MRITTNDLIVLLYFTLTTFCSVTLEDSEQLSIKMEEFYQTEKVHQKMIKSQKRIQRQNKKKVQQETRKQPGLFLALTGLFGGTIADTFKGYRNISQMVQSAFASSRQTTMSDNGTTDAPAANATSYTLRQTVALLGRNFRALRRLFDMELARALKDTRKNVLQFRRELKTSPKIFLEYDVNANTVR